MGATFGYFKGDSKFFGEAVKKKLSVKQTSYAGDLFVAYESFNDKNLKTNISLPARMEFSKNKLSRTDANNNKSEATGRLNSPFFHFDALKNVYRNDGLRLGPWVCSKYDHAYWKKDTLFPKASFTFLDAGAGLNIEPESEKCDNESGQRSDASEKHGDKFSLRLFLKGGFGFQPVRKSYVNAGTSTAMLKESYKNHLMFVAGLCTGLTDHWDQVGTWNGTFSKKYRNNLVFPGVWYSF
jgi:hypothetical protein